MAFSIREGQRCAAMMAVVAFGLAAAFSPPARAGWPPCGPFIRGDANADGELDISDPVFVLLFLFSGKIEAPACMDALDANDDESIDVSDPIALLGCLFQGGAPPPSPFPDPGTDEPCNWADDDIDGLADEGCPRNAKDPSFYPGKLAFLVSDERWQDVLPLVPLAAWSGSGSPCLTGAGAAGGTCAYPLLVFHVEGDSFDADAILDFLRRYRPERVRLAGRAPEALVALLLGDPVLGLTEDRLEALPPESIAAHWSEVHDVLLVEDDYEKALRASALASLMDAPLAIEGQASGIDLSGKRVLCVGSPSGPCAERLSIEDVEERYLAITGTDRALLVRPDLGVFKTDVKATLAGGPVHSLFGRTSLAAAPLAACKRELVLAVHSTQVDAAEAELRSALGRLGWSPSYLTIAASPLEIQQTIGFARSGGSWVTWSIDNTRYSNADSDTLGFAERKTGRIYGFTSSDVSAYVARATFHDALGYSGDFVFIGQGVGATDQRARMLSDVFGGAGYPSSFKTYADPARPADWRDKRLINNDAHGSPYYSTILVDEIPPLEGTVVLTASCLTCAFDRLSTNNYGRLFCLELLRKGAMGVVASVDTAGFTWDSTRLNGALSGNLGTMFQRAQNFDHARNTWYITDLQHSDDFGDLRADIQFLLGDPTLEVPLGPAILPATRIEITAGPDAIEILFEIHSRNIEDQGLVFAFIEGTDDFVQAKYGRFFLEAGPITLFDAYAVESPDVNPMFFGGVKLVAVQRKDDGDHAHFMVEKDLSSNPLGAVVKTTILIRIARR